MSGMMSKKIPASSCCILVLFLQLLLVGFGLADVVNVGVVLPASPPGALATQALIMQRTIQMAINEINSAGDILPANVTLQMAFQDSHSDPGQAFFAAQNAYLNGSVAVIGDLVSSLTINEQYVLRSYKVPQISAQAAEDDLSDKTRFPYFLRLCPFNSLSATALLTFVNHMGWKQIAVTFVEGTENAADLESNPFGITVSSYVITPDFSDLNQTLITIRNTTSLSVIVVIADFSATVEILNSANAQGMLGAPYVWVGGDGLANFRSGDLPTSAMQGLVAVTSSAGTGQPYADFVAKLNGDSFLTTIMPPYPSQSKHYDATYAIAKAIAALYARSVSVHDGAQLLAELQLSDFQGASGYIKFDSNGDLLNPRFDVLNWQSGNNPTTVGFWTQGNPVQITSDIVWPDGTTNIPSDDLTSKFLPIGLLLPMTGDLNILAECWHSAIMYAIDTINAEGFIPGYTITPILSDSEANQGVSILKAFDLVTENAIGVIGSGYSSDSETAQLVLANFDIAQISGSATSDDLSNKKPYPTFFRTVPTDSIQGNAMAQIINHFGWKQVSAMITDDTYSANAFSVFSGVAQSLGITVRTQQIMHTGSQDASMYINNIKNSGSRIVLMIALPGDAEVILAEAMRQGLLGDDFVWVVSDAAITISNATLQQTGLSDLIPYMKGIIGTIAAEGQGPVYDEFVTEISSLDSTQYPGLVPLRTYTTFFYDCIYAFAWAFKAMDSWGWNLKNTTLFRQALAQVNFTGVTGQVQFDRNYDRTNVNFAVMNWYSTQFEQVGIYESGTGVFTFSRDITWPNGGTLIPSDEPDRIFDENSTAAKWTFVVLAAIASALVVVAAIIFLRFRLSSVVQATNMLFAFTLIIGGILGLMSIVVYSLSPPDDNICIARVWVPSIAFALIYGALLSKYVYSFRMKKRSHISTGSVLTVLLPVLAIELIILVIWTAIPSQRPEPYFKDTSSSDTYVTWCTNSVTFVVISMVYKALLMLGGIFLVFKTGEYPSYYSESIYLRLANWTVIATTCLGVAMVYILDGQVVSMSVIYSIIVLIGVSLTMGFIFVPKCRLLLLNKEGCRDSSSL